MNKKLIAVLILGLTLFAAFSITPIPSVASAGLADLERSESFLEACGEAKTAKGVASLTCDKTASYGDYGEVQAVVVVVTGGGLRPHADVQAFAKTTCIEGRCPSFYGGVAWAKGVAQVTYWMRVKEKKTPPIVYQPPVPVYVTVRGQFSRSSGGVVAQAAVKLKRGSFVFYEQWANPTAGNFDKRFQFNTQPGEVIGVEAVAGVEAIAGDENGQGNSKNGQAVADPFFEFAQDVFDDTMGTSTFNLAEYYEFEYSPDILPARALLGNATDGWGSTLDNITSPGPTITVNQGDLVNLTLTSVDGITHSFFVDYNGDANPGAGEPKSPDFNTTTNYPFTADTPGTFTYYCQYHKGTMYGTFKVVQPSDTTPPTISIVSPENKTYTVNDVPLTFTVSESTSWMGYSLDGQANVTITGNTTLNGLPNGLHSLIVHAEDEDGNIGSSDTVYFTIQTSPIDTTPPSISIVSPQNKTYDTGDIPLTFTVDESVSWMAYNLDNKANMTIAGNTTLSELSDGTHSLTVYTKDTAGNTGASEIIYFSIKTQQAEPLQLWILGVLVIVALVGTALLVYFKKVKKTTEKVE